MPSLMNRVRRSVRPSTFGPRFELLETRQLLAATVVQAPPAVTGAATTSLNVDLSTYLNDPAGNTTVRFATELGNVDVELFDQQKPITVTNFLSYVRPGLFDTTIIHRSVKSGISVIQGGGYKPPTFEHIETLNEGITNEAEIAPALSNTRGTIAMARTDEPNSATSEWFINTADNLQLNPGGVTPAGYAVFGQVVPSTLPVVDAIQALPIFQFGGAFGEIPLRNYTSADFSRPQGPKTPTADNFVSVDASTLPKLTYSASSSNPAVANVSVSGGQLTVQYASVGTTDITITGVDGDGGTVSQTFTATVTEAPSLVVTLGAAGGPTSVSFTDADGTASTISIKGGGTAAVTFAGTGLTETTVRTKSTVAGTPTGVSSVAITGGSGSTAVTVTGRGGNNAVNLGGLTANSALKSIAAKPASLTGTLNVTGAVGKVDLGDVNNATITLGGAASDRPAAVTLGTSTGTSITSAAPLKSVTGTAFVAGQSAAGTISAPALDKLTSKGDFGQDVDVTGAIKAVAIAGNLSGAIRGDTIGSVAVRGNVNGAAIAARRVFNAAEKPLGKVTVSGSLTNAIISAAGNITSVSAGSAQSVTIFSGIATTASATAVPSQPADFESPATIGSVTIKGTTADTIIGADTIGKATLGTVTTTNDGKPLGVGADSIGALTGTIGGTKFSLKKLETQADVQAQSQGLTLGDFQITVI